MNKISIIIPVYNIENYLDKTLTSITEQTYKNIEILLINDGSTDRSREICDSWSKKDTRIQCFHKDNEGVSAARNLGFSKSTGEYILFIDGDDEIAPDMCEKLLSRLNFEKADFCVCGYKNIFRDTTENLVMDCSKLENKEILNAFVYDLSFFTAVWNKLFKRSLLCDSDGHFISFQTGIHVGEDALWLSKILKKTQKAAVLPEALYFWKRREDSATQGGSSIRTDERYLTVLKAYREIVLEMNPEDLKKVCCKKYLGTARDCMIQAYKENNFLLSKTLLSTIRKDKKLYNKTDLFVVKLRICCMLVNLHAPVKVIEFIQNSQKK